MNQLIVGTPGLHSQEFTIKFKEVWNNPENWNSVEVIVSDIPKRLPRKLKKKLFKYTVKLV